MDGGRLLEEGSERERALLRAGVDEAPTSESVRSAARALGLVPRVAFLAYGARVLLRVLKGSPATAYFAAPALLIGAMVATYAVAERRSTSAPSAASTSMVAPASSATGSEGATEALEPVASEAVPLADIAEAPALDSAPAAVGRAVRSPARDVSSDAVRQEVIVVDRARALVASGDTAGALRVVDTYEHRFPRGVLAEEALLLRIEAVAARGDHAGAAALAQRFRAEYPRSVHMDRLRWLSDGSK